MRRPWRGILPNKNKYYSYRALLDLLWYSTWTMHEMPALQPRQQPLATLLSQMALAVHRTEVAVTFEVVREGDLVRWTPQSRQSAK